MNIVLSTKNKQTSITNLLKAEIAKELDDKYLTLTTQLHWIANYLDPSFKELLFVSDKLYLAEQKKMIKHGTSITFSANSFTNDIEQDIQIYENAIYEVPEDNNPLILWRDQQQSLPILSKIAKSVFVIQASSAESERHFSMVGQIVTERRSQLDPEYVEVLVVLKES